MIVETTSETVLFAPIVGLPYDDPESELAQSKLRKTLEGLSKSYRSVLNVQATVRVRAKSPEGRRRYRVKVGFDVPGHRYEFVEEDWSLANAFDQISDRMKRLQTKPLKKESYKPRVTRAEFEEENL